jgi:transposase-like protein
VAERRKYNDGDRAQVFTALTINQGNIKRSARETGVPVSTVRLWKKEWEEQGPSEEVALLAAEAATRFVATAENARDLALAKWQALVEEDKVAARDLMTGVGVLTDKIHAAKGLSKGGSSQPAISPEHMRELARGLVEGAVEAAKARDREIIDAEEVIYEIPSGTS